MDLSKRDPIAVVLDDRVPREKLKLLTHIINEVRRFAMVQVFDGNISEEDLLKRLAEKPYRLTLVPWYRYFAWRRAEAYFGLTRNSGPAYAGYFADQLQPFEIGEQTDQVRAILLDFANSSASEAVQLVRTLLKENQRSGMRPFLQPNTPTYCETWMGGQPLGPKLDAVLALPEITKSEWASRSSALRVCMTALWSLIYEEGPGKADFGQAAAGKNPRAYFQVGVDDRCLAFRICYSMPGWTPKTALSAFWPDAKRPDRPTQLLLRYADLIRLHLVTDSPDVELFIALLPSAPSLKAHGQMRAFWIEPIASQLILEIPFETPTAASPLLKPLTAAYGEPTAGTAKAAQEAEEKAQARAKERFIFHAAMKIRELKKAMTERDEVIRELRSGGIGSAAPLPPPDAEGLLDAFQERFLDAEQAIHDLEQEVAKAEQQGAEQQELEAIRVKINQLMNREQGWIRKIAATLDLYRKANKRRESGTG